ncbi:hypothetical protein Lser_V15G25074 [Lactuca serriola]
MSIEGISSDGFAAISIVGNNLVRCASLNHSIGIKIDGCGEARTFDTDRCFLSISAMVFAATKALLATFHFKYIVGNAFVSANTVAATYLIETHKVEAILGLQTLEEVLSVSEVCSEAQVPTFSLFDSVPQRALDRWPYLFQASPSQFPQTKAFVAILESYGWSRFTFIYEDINSASTQVIPHLMEAIKDSSVEISSIVKLSPLSSSFSLPKQLESISKEQCRVFLLHSSLETGVRLFQNAKNMGMMEKGYVWITTSLITDLLHTVNSSTFSTILEGVLGIGSFFSQFDDFSTKFQKKFKLEQPEEENNIPGVFAVQAYDATLIVALALTNNNTSWQSVDQKPPASHKFPIINVIGKYYRELGFWSEGLGFSEVINDKTTYDTSLKSLGYIFWPGKPLHTPIGWAIPTNANPLRVGVPTMAMFKKFVEVKYDHKNHNLTYRGYSVELFKETIKLLPYYLPYEFHPFNGTYDSLVEQVYLKKFDLIRDALHSNLTRMTTVAWLLAAIIIGQCYTASLTSQLTVKRLIPKVTDFETLKNGNAVVGYGQGAHVASYLVDVLGFKNRNIRPFTSPEGYARALKNKEISAVFLEAPFTKLFLAKYCNSFIAAGPTFGDGGFAFVLPKGSPMVADFTKALLNVSESGTLQEIEKKMIGSEKCVEMDSDDDEYESLGLGSFSSLLVLTSGTSTVALVIYVVISLRDYCRIQQKSISSIFSDVKKYFMNRRRRFSRKLSNVESPKSPNLEMT